MLRTGLLCVALLLQFAACGVGGVGDVDPVPLDASLFAGEFHAFFLKGFDNQGQRFVTSAWGKVTADGEGALTTNLRENQDGFLTGPAPLTLLTYEVDPDRAMRWYFPAVSGAVSWRGAVSIDGEMAVLSSARTGSDPEIIVLFRTGTDLSADDLRDSHHFARFAGLLDRGIPGDPHTLGTVGTVHFGRFPDPMDVYTSHSNADGEVTTGPFVESGEYTVASDGTATYVAGPRTSAPITYEGATLAGGGLLVLGGTVAPPDLDRLVGPQLYILVRETNPLTSVPNLAGAYDVVGLRHDRDGRQYRSVLGRLLADGAGGGTMTYSENVNRTLGAGRSEDVAYVVSPTGRLDMRWEGACGAGGPCLRGGVASSGAYAMLGGGFVDGADPAIYFLIRR